MRAANRLHCPLFSGPIGFIAAVDYSCIHCLHRRFIALSASPCLHRPCCIEVVCIAVAAWSASPQVHRCCLHRRGCIGTASPLLPVSPCLRRLGWILSSLSVFHCMAGPFCLHCPLFAFRRIFTLSSLSAFSQAVAKSSHCLNDCV